MFLEDSKNLLAQTNSFQIPLNESYTTDLIPIFKNMSQMKFNFNKIESKLPVINTYKEYFALKKAYNSAISLAITLVKPKYDNIDALIWAIKDLIKTIINIFVFILIAPMILAFIIAVGLLVLVAMLIGCLTYILSIIFGENKTRITSKNKKDVKEIKVQLKNFINTMEKHKSGNKNHQEVIQLSTAIDITKNWSLAKLENI